MRRLLVVLVLVLLPAASAPAAVYVSNPGAGQIAQLSDTGAPLTPATVAAASAGPLVATPDGTRLYAATTGAAGNAAILGFAVHGNGTLEALGSTPVAGANSGGSLAVTGTSLYFAASSGSVFQFTIADDGSLAPKLAPSVAVPDADGIVVSPDGLSAYVTESGSTALAQFSIVGGLLVEKLAPTVTVAADPHPQPVVAPNGDVYVLLPGSGKLLEFAPDVTGALAPLSPASVDVVTDADADLALSADGKSLYESGFAGGAVAQYDVAASGQVAPKSTPAVGVATAPVHLAIGPNTVYVAAGAAQNAVQLLTEGAGGALTAGLSTSVFAAGMGRPADIVAAPPEAAATATPTPTATATATATDTATATPTATETASPTPTATPSVSHHRVARLGAIGRRAKVRHRRAHVTVACRPGGATCRGVLRLRRGGRRVGKHHFTIASGARKTIKVRVRKRARTLLAGARHGHLRVRARARAGASHASRGIVLLRRHPARG